MVAQPDQRVWRLPFLPEEERTLLAVWNNTWQHLVPGESQDIRVQHLFEAQAARTPRAGALVVRGEVLSYAQLNRRANQLAHRLRSLGVGPDVAVGICLPPEAPEATLASLAVLKAREASLPLAITASTERRAQLLNETQATVLITWQGYAGEGHRAHVLCLETDRAMLARESTENPLCEVMGEQSAAVLYPTGPVAASAGVVIEHRQFRRPQR